MMKKEAERILKKDINLNVNESLDLIGMLDSYGVPYSPNVQDSFFEMLCQDLESEEKLNSSLDLYNLYINKTWHLNGLYDNDVTIGEFKKLQNFSLDFVKHKYPDMVKDDIGYDSLEKDRDISIYDYTAALKNPVILYSCAANDLFYYYGFSLESLNAKRIKELVAYYSDAIQMLQKNVESNILTLLNCNERAQIFVMGLYLPSDNYFLYRIGMPVVNKINKALKEVCDKYDHVYFVDVSCVSFCVLEGDFHPDADGQKIIAYKLSQAMNEHLDFPDTPFISKESQRKQNVINADQQNVKMIAEAIHRFLTASELPLKDYVEYSVGIEEALKENGYETTDYKTISMVKEYFLREYNEYDEYDRAEIEQAFDIIISERKILFGIDEKSYSRNPENVSNDKLSLMEYY